MAEQEHNERCRINATLLWSLSITIKTLKKLHIEIIVNTMECSYTKHNVVVTIQCTRLNIIYNYDDFNITGLHM